jgi:hypothetical protein
MRLVKVTLQGGKEVAINPAGISHLQPLDGQPGCMLFMDGDGMPTNLDSDYLELHADINNAMGDGGGRELEALHIDWAKHAADLIVEIRRLQWAFGISALAFFVLLLILISRGH